MLLYRHKGKGLSKYSLCRYTPNAWFPEEYLKNRGVFDFGHFILNLEIALAQA